MPMATPAGPIGRPQHCAHGHWLQLVALQVADRFGLPPGRPLAPFLLAPLLAKQDPKAQAMLRKVIAGTFYAGEHTAHWADTATCRHCGQPDGIDHRLIECEATAQARAAMPDTWTRWPRHLRQFLLPVAPESLERLQQCRSSCTDQPWWFDQEAGDGPLHLFTDGSTTHTACPESRVGHHMG